MTLSNRKLACIALILIAATCMIAAQPAGAAPTTPANPPRATMEPDQPHASISFTTIPQEVAAGGSVRASVAVHRDTGETAPAIVAIDAPDAARGTLSSTGECKPGRCTVSAGPGAPGNVWADLVAGSQDFVVTATLIEGGVIIAVQEIRVHVVVVPTPKPIHRVYIPLAQR